MHGRQQESDAGAASTGVTDHDLEVVRTGYDLWNAGDVEALAGTCFAEDIEYTNSPEWPGQQTYHGAEAVARFLVEEVVETIGLSEIVVEDAEIFGNEILVTLLARTRGTHSGVDIGNVRVFHVVRMRDGRVGRVRVYLERGQAVEAAGGSGE